VNPVSGRGRGVRAAGELALALRRNGVEAEVLETRARGDAGARLSELARPVDLVVSVGGDGTLREVLDGLPDPTVPVGILPYGTSNCLALQLRMPRAVRANLAALLGARTIPLDVMRTNGHLSFLMTGVGFDARCVREVELRRAGPIRRSTYLGATWRALRGYRPPRLRVAVDGRELPGDFGQVIVGNALRYAGVVQLSRRSRLHDGELEVYLFRSGRPWTFARAFVRGMLGEMVGPGVELAIGTRVRISAEGEPVPFQIDGDLGGTTPVELEIVPRRHRLVVP
jgi:diacylglycerol kinase family enzyme